MLKGQQNIPKRVTNFDQQIGLRIRQIRKKQRLSQEDLGKKIGVSFQQVQKYENGANRISASRLVQVSHVLGVSVNFFLDVAAPGLPARTIDGVRQEFNEAVRHLNNVGESIGLVIRTELMATAA